MKYLFLLSGLLLLVSCSTSTYYCSTMNTKDPYTIKNEWGDFVVEGDGFDIVYNFFGKNAPITVGVVNKTSKLLYIDWCKSGIVLDDVPTTYKETIYPANDDDSRQVDFKYFMDNSDCLSFVKPYTHLNKQTLELAGFNFKAIDDVYYANGKTEADSWGKNENYNTIKYSEDDSPVYVRTFLTLYADSSNVRDAYYYEADFYMSELIKITAASPQSIAAFRNGRGDFFYVKEEKQKARPKEKKNSPGLLKKAVHLIETWAVEGSKAANSDPDK